MDIKDESAATPQEQVNSSQASSAAAKPVGWLKILYFSVAAIPAAFVLGVILSGSSDGEPSKAVGALVGSTILIAIVAALVATGKLARLSGRSVLLWVLKLW